MTTSSAGSVEPHSSVAESAAALLGYLSIGLGAAELLAPRLIAREIGATTEASHTLRLCGFREIASGVAILSPKTRNIGLWARAIGDVMDLATIEKLRSQDAESARLRTTRAWVIGVTAIDILAGLAALRSSASRRPAELKVSETIAINDSPEALYDFWRHLPNLPRIMTYLDSVELIGARKSHWVAKVPGGATVEWDAEITTDLPGKRLAWKSLAGSDFMHEGAVYFIPLPGRRGTAVHVDTTAEVKGTLFGNAATRLFSKISQHKLKHDLRRFKQIIEAGEVTTTDGQSAGRRSGSTWLDSVARF